MSRAPVHVPNRASPPSANCTLSAAQITVGQKIVLDCTGQFKTPPSADLQVVPATPANAYQLYVLKVAQSSSTEVKATVTGYRVGKINNQIFILSDGNPKSQREGSSKIQSTGTVTFQTSPLSLTVASVMNPSHPVSKPYSSIGPFRMAYPVWLWYFLIAIALLLVGVIVQVFLRRRRRRHLRKEMEKHAVRLPAYAQFSKDARAAARKLVVTRADSEAPELLARIEEDFRLYLIRELHVPALQVSDRELLSEIRRSQKAVYQQCQSELRRFFFELAKSHGDDRAQLKIKDCEDLLYLSRHLADNIQAIKRKDRSNFSSRMRGRP